MLKVVSKSSARTVWEQHSLVKIMRRGWAGGRGQRSLSGIVFVVVALAFMYVFNVCPP